ncbi:MAG: glucose 1-dehydrogenase [Candidatus Brockarchaeota archaeon]|nr:glucose 1-dehydrogenase [Candidatus Brockarchaeota archaeon]
MASFAKDLYGKVVMITGGAAGTGRATALLLAEAGASLALVDTETNHGEDTAMEAKERGGDAVFVKADVTEIREIDHAVSKTLEKFGKIDALVNNAGANLVADVEETEEFDFDRIVDVNFKGAFFCSKAVIPVMKKQGGGAIVNVASVSAHVGQPMQAAYAGTKGAVLGMTKAMAMELAPYNIRVNSVSPGAVEAPMLRSCMEMQFEARGISIEEVRKELAREGMIEKSPDGMAPIVLFLCSDKASSITGVAFLVDAGWFE